MHLALSLVVRSSKRPTSKVGTIQILATAILAVLASLASTLAPGTASSNQSSDESFNERSDERSAQLPLEVRWETVALAAARDAIHAVAIAPGARFAFAVGDSRGVLVGSGPDALRRHWLRGAVREVRFVAAIGTHSPDLLIATESGLYRADFASAGRPVAPAPGAGAADVSRIATAGRVTAIATADGVFLSLDAQVWQRLGGGVPTGPASSVALKERSDGIECWAVIRGQLWRVFLQAAVSATPQTPSRSTQALSQQTSIHQTLFHQTLFHQTSASPIELPLGPGRGEAVDIALDIDGSEIVVVYDSAIVVSRADDSMESGLGWDVLRPELAPGASIVELAQAIGWCWLASDRGLFRSRNLRGPWLPANGPFATRPIGDLAAIGRESADSEIEHALYVATDRGLMVGTAGLGVAVPPSLPQHDSADPGIDRVHRAALDYLELDPGRVREINRGLDRRGWLPAVAFSISRDRDKSRSWDYDEAYLSGGLRELRDSDRDRATGLELRLSLVWDLGDIAYHPERLDISREAREIIELRDEVLDEVTQLYFERQRVLAEIHSISGDGDGLPLQIRADQLAAGIDAWTGGWFSRRLPESDPLAGSTQRDPAPRDPRRHSMARDSGDAPSPVPNASESILQ